jgi:hypothetical protein
MPVVTSLYAALLALLLVVLAVAVVRVRLRDRVGIGHGGNDRLALRVRAHANFTEYVPMALLLLLLLEVCGTDRALLHAFGILLVVARLLHAFGLSRSAGRSLGRLTGAGLTFLLIAAMALLLLAYALQRLL